MKSAVYTTITFYACFASCLAQSPDGTRLRDLTGKLDSVMITPAGFADVAPPQMQVQEGKTDRNPNRITAIKQGPNDSDSTKSNLSKIDSLSNNAQRLLPEGAKDSTNFNFKDTDLRDIFRAISLQHALNIFLDNSISKRATIALNKVRVYDAIKFLCDENNLILQLDGGIFKILPPPPPPKPEPPLPKIPVVSYENHFLSVQLKDDDLEKVVGEIEKKAGFNILIMGGTSGTITGTLTKAEFDIGFTQLMNTNGFAVEKKSGIYLVSKLDYFIGQNGQSLLQKTGPYWVSVKDSLVSIDVTNAPLERVLPDIVRQLNTDVVFYNALTGTITARATDVSLPRAFDLILRNTNFTYRESDGLFFVGEKTNKTLAETKLIKLNHLRADKIMDLIPQSITSQAVVKPIKEQNGIVIIASRDVINQMDEFLAEIDRPVAQVLIEALVVDYNLSNEKDFGIQAGWLGKPDSSGVMRSGSIIPGIDVSATGGWLTSQLQQMGQINILGHAINMSNVSLPADFYFKLNALEQKGLASIKSRPVLATLNGQPASLSVGTTQYFLLHTTTPYQSPNQVLVQQSETFQTIDADVKLEITPYVGADSLITLDIKPDFKTPVGQLNANIPPTINRRALSSTVVIKEGETIVLGGLVEDEESETRSQVPILGSIPILGNLFASTSKTNQKSELLIYVTPHISYGEQFQNISVKLPEE